MFWCPMEKIKPYTLFINITYENGNKHWYGWKSYQTSEIAIDAFKQLRKKCSVFDSVQIGSMAKIVGYGSATFYKGE